MQFLGTLKQSGLIVHPPKRREVTDEEIQAAKAAFYEADEGHKGWLSREDFKVAAIMLLGYKPSKVEVDDIFCKLRLPDSDGGPQGLLVEDFVRVMVSRLQLQDEDECIRRTFLAFDSQCQGFLRAQELRTVMAQVAPRMPEHVINAAFRELDRDGDGRVSFNDFLFMMRYKTGD